MSDSNITKLALASSLKELMSDMPLSRISVGNIVNHCGLNRQTFYYHFKDKYDLVNWIYYTETVEHMKTFSDKDHWSDGLFKLLCYMQKNRKFYINALNTPGQNSFSEYLIQFTHEIILSLVYELHENKITGREDLDFIADFYTYAFVGVILKWARHGMKEDPKQYVDRIKNLIIY